ncbi:MAG: hypothetical protein U0905_08225 [Pirellulales bacterium]
MNHVLSLSQRMAGLGLGLLLSVLTGCMIGPTDGQHLGYEYGSYIKPITAGGFLAKPNTTVLIQAYNWRLRRWDTVATTRSRSSSYHWDGRDWYYWQTTSFRLSTPYWNSYWGEADCKLRAVSEDVNLVTFREWNWTADSTLGDVAEGVNGFEVTIHAMMFETDP